MREIIPTRETHIYGSCIDGQKYPRQSGISERFPSQRETPILGQVTGDDDEGTEQDAVGVPKMNPYRYLSNQDKLPS